MNSIHPALLASELLFPYLYYFSCFIANVFFLSGPLSNLTCPTFNVQRRILLSFHQLGKRKSSDCLSSGTAQVSQFYKVFLYRNLRRWMNDISFSFSSNWHDGQPCRHIGWGRRKNYSLFDQQELFEKPQINSSSGTV